MKTLITVTLMILFMSCQNNTDDANKIQTDSKTKFFQEINELEEFKDFERGAGASIDQYFSIGLYGNIKKENIYLVAFKKVKFENGQVRYQIIDTLLMDNLEPNHYIGIGDCRINGRVDKEIIVIYEDEDDVEFYTKIKKAWRADRGLMKIVEIDTTKIDFINEGYGA